MTFDLGRCPLCEKAIVHEVGKKPICPECSERVNELYSRARSLLRDYAERRMSVSDVAEILKVDERDVNYLVEEGRLERVEEWYFKDDVDSFFVGNNFDAKPKKPAPAPAPARKRQGRAVR